MPFSRSLQVDTIDELQVIESILKKRDNNE